MTAEPLQDGGEREQALSIYSQQTAGEEIPASAIEPAEAFRAGWDACASRERTALLDERECWTIRICECGFPLGATLAVLRLLTCPDCGRSVVPIEDGTRSVDVVRGHPHQDVERSTAEMTTEADAEDDAAYEQWVRGRNLTAKQARKKRDGREVAAFVALADGDWASFEDLRKRTGMKGRALKGALGRLMCKGQVRERGSEPDQEYRRISPLQQLEGR